jgi:hypothetical protein
MIGASRRRRKRRRSGGSSRMMKTRRQPLRIRGRSANSSSRIYIRYSKRTRTTVRRWWMMRSLPRCDDFDLYHCNININH